MRKNGRKDITIYEIGKVLYYIPEDKDSLWINENIAIFLNDISNKKARDGFINEILNSRGVYHCDYKAEESLANEWKKKADTIKDCIYLFDDITNKIVKHYQDTAKQYKGDKN